MPLEIKVPAVGESISEVEIGQWLKKTGDPVREGETVAVLESEKATVELPAPAAGFMGRLLKAAGQVATIGEIIAEIEAGPVTATTTANSAPPVPAGATVPKEAVATPRVMPSAERVLTAAGMAPTDVTGTGPGGRIVRADAVKAAERTPAKAAEPTASTPVSKAIPTAPPRPVASEHRREEPVRMSRLRRTVAARLVAAKSEMALLTTFNEIDMSAVMTLRKDLQEAFTAKHGIKLGFMSIFVKAVIDALKLVPQLNAEIQGDDLVYKHYYDIGVAIGGGKGLVVPVIRNAERLSFAELEKAIAGFAVLAKDGKLMPEDLAGGTFTVTNGGVYGSLLSTPIVNPPQSGVLGMHAIQERPVAIAGAVVIRPMMYVALTYDHRIVDGREAVIFLKRIKDTVENPVRMLVEA